MGRSRAARLEDCERFARLTDALPNQALQSTCIVPSDVSPERADALRLARALMYGVKPIVTGTVYESSVAVMLDMLRIVRGGGEALRRDPLAIFDCCPSSPLGWTALSADTLMACARAGVPVQVVSMPMPGATAPVTPLDALTQLTAEVLSGVTLVQLAAPGGVAIFGSALGAFDLRKGVPAPGAAETMRFAAACAQVGRALGLPTQAYLGLTDAGGPDGQAGMESAMGVLCAVMAGLDVASGPGMIDTFNGQCLEALVLADEGCGLALRMAEPIHSGDFKDPSDRVREGLEAGDFLALDHTLRHAREIMRVPSSVVKRDPGFETSNTIPQTAGDRAASLVRTLLNNHRVPPLDADRLEGIRRLTGEG